MNSLSRRWAALTFAMLGWWAATGTAQAHAATMINCPKIQQAGKVAVNSQLHFTRKSPEFVEVWQETSIALPKKNGEFSDDLTLSPHTPKYQYALHCLLLRAKNAQKSIDAWYPEWQSVSYGYGASKKNSLTALSYHSWNLIRSAGRFEVGPWEVTVAPDADWVATLHPSDDLVNASWQTITVDPGGLEVSDASGAATINKDSDSRVWSGHRPNVHISIVPPRDLSLNRRTARIASLGVASWWVCASAVIAASALALLHCGRKKSEGTEASASRLLSYTALQWSGLSVALGLTLLLLLRPSPAVNPWRDFIGISSGLALILLARPWLPLNQDSDHSPKNLARRKAVVAASAGAAAAAGLLVIIAPHLFGLPPNLVPTARPPSSGLIGLFLLDLSVLWLWLGAMASWAWRFAREGRLGERSSGAGPGNPESVTGRRSEYGLRYIAGVGTGLAVVAVAVVAFRVLSFELKWERANWMGEAAALFGTDHRSALSRELADFASRGPQWMYAYTWMLTGIALLALLHSISLNEPETSLGPERVNLLLVAAIFAVAVATRSIEFAGKAAAVYGLWLPLNMVALYAMVKIGGRWSVLSRVARRMDKQDVVKALSDREKHEELLSDSRRCRDLLHQLHLVDQGRDKETGRDKLEEELSALHRWRPAQSDQDCLPGSVSVVDIALSWGPRSRWWGNALFGARWAAVFGILPSIVAAWYENAYGAEHWTFTINLPTGVPDAIGDFLTREISFAGAGLVLGALWRVLPGERGPMRAASLFIAWLVPVGAVAAINDSIGHRELGMAVLNVVLMLMVLTLTSMWMDIETFSRERHYWTKRLGLLASIYQVHGLSGQIAFLFAQGAAVVAIWHDIATT